MARRRKHLYKQKLGTSPGTLTYIGQDIEHETRIRRIQYNEATYEIDDSGKLSHCRLPSAENSLITWISVDGIHEPKVIESLGQQFRLHRLMLEDILNTLQKPKLEQYDEDTLFVTIKMLRYNATVQEVDTEHISFVLGRQYLLSFQEEREGDIFQPVLKRIVESAGKTRRNGPDYLLYALMDLVVDNYFMVLEQIGSDLEDIEDRIVQNSAGQPTLASLYGLKRELAVIRRAIWPLRDMLGLLIREESPLMKANTNPYLRDLYDHVMQVLETIESYRELMASLLDVYLSTVSNRMNSVMKTLTIFSAIFMPLTFIAGIYGMNFDVMPELRDPLGYYKIWIFMGLLAVVMIIYFRRRGWM
ncbi:magnesium/cobalt transporter CorA [Nibrella saemangeumensis]|uniref:Magnesium transport protein CorA n=2 Tax=Nibrella saemangeumensis TaxID=1084526 RepID=A0ABP8MXL2_9BACT